MNIFRTPELGRKILFTIFIVVIYRLGVQIPAPGVNLEAVKALNETDASVSGIGSYLTLLTGSGLGASLFALGILPYITSSIMIQILTVAIPKLEEWQSQGAVGQRKITQWTRYIAVILALVQSAGTVFAINRGAFGDQLTGLFPDNSLSKMALAVFCMTIGTAIVMWLGELVTQKGIGNGMSVIIFASVVASMPAIGGDIFAVYKWIGVAVGVALLIGLVAGIVYIEQGMRKIPVNFAKRVVGRRESRPNNSYIPLKVNQAGVIPVIFASSLLQLPTLLVNFLPVTPTDNPFVQVANPNIWDRIAFFISNDLYSPTNIVYILGFGLLIVGFTYFYNSIAFDPAQKADEINKQGGFIPGVRPGPQTETYLAKILNRITLPGSIFLAAVALVPSAALQFAISGDQTTSGLAGFGGISILIAVGVSLEMMKQINSQLMARNYEGFLK